MLDTTYFQKQKLAPAGGMGSPLVEFISYMSKQYGDNPILGEEFMKTLVDSRWSKTTLHPFVKVALTVTNCTSMKIVYRWGGKVDYQNRPPGFESKEV